MLTFEFPPVCCLSIEKSKYNEESEKMSFSLKKGRKKYDCVNEKKYIFKKKIEKMTSCKIVKT